MRWIRKRDLRWAEGVRIVGARVCVYVCVGGYIVVNGVAVTTLVVVVLLTEEVSVAQQRVFCPVMTQ